MHQQQAATGEISQNVMSAAQSAKEIVNVLGDVTGAATETRSSAETVLAASQAVETAAADLRQEVEGFLQKVAGEHAPHGRAASRGVRSPNPCMS